METEAITNDFKKSKAHTNPFLIYPQSVIASDLTQAQKAILCALITDYRKRKTDNISELYNREIALLAGLKRGTVANNLPDLKRKGYIQITGFLRNRKIHILKDYSGEPFLAVPVIEAKPATRLVAGYVQGMQMSYSLVYPSNATGGAACGMSDRSFSAHVAKLKAAGLLNSRCVYNFEKLHWRRYLKLDLEAVAKAAIVTVKTVLTEPSPNPKPQKKQIAPKYAPIFAAYRTECEELIKQRRIAAVPIIEQKRVMKRLKQLVDTYGVDTVCECIRKAAGDWWVLSTGFALKTIIATNVFNRLLNGRQQKAGATEGSFAPIFAVYHTECEKLVKAGKLKHAAGIPSNAADLLKPLADKYGVDTVCECIRKAAAKEWIVGDGFTLTKIANRSNFEYLRGKENGNDGSKRD